MTCAEFFLYLVNGIFLLAGLGITGLSSYLIWLHDASTSSSVSSSTDIVQEIANALPSPLLIPLLGLGLVCTLVALLGICGVCTKRAVLGRCAIWVYAIIILVIIIAEVSIGGALFAWESGSDIGDVQNQEQQLIARVAREVYPRCCDNSSHTVIPQPPPAGDPVCPLPDEKDVIKPGDCHSPQAFESALDTVLKRIVIPVASATLALAALQILALIIVCWVSSEGRRQAQAAEEARRRGEAVDPTVLWLVDDSLYGDSAGGSRRAPGAFGNAATTPQYVSF